MVLYETMPSAVGAVRNIIIWTDGSFNNHTKHGGWGAVIIPENGLPVKIKGDRPQTTSGHMELMAAIDALEKLPRASNVKIYTDYEFLCILNRSSTWKYAEKGNELIDRFYWAAHRHNHVECVWVRGHSGICYNEAAHRLAYSAIPEDSRIALPRPGLQSLAMPAQ